MFFLLLLACKDSPDDSAAPVDADGDGWIATEDCDDLDPRRYPEAEERCGDGVVNPCGGSEAEATDLCAWPSSLDDADATLLGDAAHDAAGTQVRLAADVDGDALADLLVAAPHDRTFATRGGVLHVVGGAVSGEQVLDGPDAQLYYGDAYEFPLAFAGLGDLDGDGLGDLAVTTAEEGLDWHVRLLSGPFSGDIEVEGNASGDIVTSDKPSELGWSIDGADLDGDGAVDLVLGDPAQTFAGDDSGGAFVVFGHLSGTIYAEDYTVFAGTRAGARAGEAVAVVGDVNGDGSLDVMVGAPHDGLAGEDAGAAVLVAGPVLPHFHHQLDAPAPVLRGAQPGALLGRALGQGGDVDGDGYGESLIAAAAGGTGALDAGAVYVVEGEGVGDPSDAVASLIGEEGQDLGHFLCGAGDLDGDGHGDLAVSGPGGTVLLYYGPLVGVFGAADADHTFTGEGGDGSGPLGCGLDLSGDGRPDLLVGRPGFAGRAEGAGGAALLLAPGY